MKFLGSYPRLSRDLLLVFCLAAAAPAFAQSTPSNQPAPSTGTAAPAAPTIPAAEYLLLLVRNALAAVNQANLTGNYTVLHAMGSPTFQSGHTPAKLGDVFSALRNQGVDIAPALVLTPQLTETPGFTTDNRLRLAGYFPTQPLRIEFIILYIKINESWRIDGISVAATPVTAQQEVQPSSPNPPSEGPAKAKPKPK